MKKFIKSTLVFGFLLAVVVIVLEGLLPSTLFTNRGWETIRVRNQALFIGPFYPFQDIKQGEVGDLAHHTEYEIARHDVHWQTDGLGFRNVQKPQKNGVVLLGDSNIAGNSIDRGATLSDVLSKNIANSVYNLAPAHFNDFVYLIENNIIPKPKVLVHGIVERNIMKLSSIEKIDKGRLTKWYFSSLYQKLAILIDKVFYKKCFRNYINARFRKSKGKGKLSKTYSGMLFLEGKKAEKIFGYKRIKRHANRIKEYSNYCQTQGIDYIFFPIPNKETVYFEHVPIANQPNYLIKLQKQLDRIGVNTINALKQFNLAKARSDTLLYHKDDSHWNKYGIKIIAGNLMNEIQH